MASTGFLEHLELQDSHFNSGKWKSDQNEISIEQLPLFIITSKQYLLTILIIFESSLVGTAGANLLKCFN